MYFEVTHQDVQQMVQQALSNDEGLAAASLAQQLKLTEGAVTFALPKQQVVAVDGAHTESILTQLPSWGNMTTIVYSLGSIFEFKAPFPKGKMAHGYYNIMGKEGLHGHLLIDVIKHIAFVSKPFHGMETHYIGFFDETGNCVFKVYVGRDKKRQLLTEQVALFNTLKKELSREQ